MSEPEFLTAPVMSEPEMVIAAPPPPIPAEESISSGGGSVYEALSEAAEPESIRWAQGDVWCTMYI